MTGSCLKLLLQRCKRLKTLFMANTRNYFKSLYSHSHVRLELDNKIIQSLEWEKTGIEEMDIRGTELTSETITNLLTRLNYLRWLDASWLENFTDQVNFLTFFVDFGVDLQNIN